MIGIIPTPQRIAFMSIIWKLVIRPMLKRLEFIKVVII
jgi:hypothetical protein